LTFPIASNVEVLGKGETADGIGDLVRGIPVLLAVVGVFPFGEAPARLALVVCVVTAGRRMTSEGIGGAAVAVSSRDGLDGEG
jgi:hypothetical protein